MQVKISQAIPMISNFIKAKLVPMIEGSPGMGKSAIVHQIAEQYGLKLIDLRLSQCDPTELMGFPSIGSNIDRTKARAGYVPMDTFPLEDDSIPSGHNGWLLFLDEFNSAPPAVQAAAYKLVLDRAVGQRKLHKNVAIVCAGNKETDGAIVQPMSTALQSRLVHFELQVDVEEWCDWASSKGIDHRILSYLGYRPEAIYNFSADHTDKTYACPRTWEFANRILQVVDTNQHVCLQMLAGTIGEGVAREFIGFCKIQDQLPTLAQIIASPESTAIPDDISAMWALSGALGSRLDEANSQPIMKYMKRLPIEIQVFSLRSAIRRNPKLMASQALLQWITTTGVELF